MKLTRAVEALELAAAGKAAKPGRRGKRGASRAPAGSRVGLVWTVDETPLGRPLASGEFLATDLFRTGPAVDGAGVQRVVERATLNPRDLGLVYDAAGERIGRVVRRNGSLITTALDASAGGPA